jgi:hypothetical protein
MHPRHIPQFLPFSYSFGSVLSRKLRVKLSLELPERRVAHVKAILDFLV